MCSSEFLECLPFYETFFASSSAIHEIPCCWLCCLHSLGGGTKWTAQVKMCHDDAAGGGNEREKGLKLEIWRVLRENLGFNCWGQLKVSSINAKPLAVPSMNSKPIIKPKSINLTQFRVLRFNCRILRPAWHRESRDYVPTSLNHI